MPTLLILAGQRRGNVGDCTAPAATCDATGTVTPGVSQGGGGARRILFRIVGRGQVVAPAGTGQGAGSLILAGQGNARVTRAQCEAHGRLRVAGRGQGVARRARLHGQAYAANPGEWVVVIEAEAGECVDAVVRT